MSNKARAVMGKEGVVGQKLTKAFLGQINLIAPPLYVVTAQTMERIEGLELLNKAVDAIKENITAAGGVFQIQEAVSFLLHFFLATCSVATHSPLHKASKKGLPSKKHFNSLKRNNTINIIATTTTKLCNTQSAMKVKGLPSKKHFYSLKPNNTINIIATTKIM